jgi:hypothetical protein
LACSSSPTTTTTARLLKPSNGRNLRRWADGNTFVCHNAQYYSNVLNIAVKVALTWAKQAKNS